jgi:hypothetical protein
MTSGERDRREQELRAEVATLRDRFAQAAPLSQGGHGERGPSARRPGLGRYFTPDPVKSGVEHYRLRESGYSVWAIIGALRAADGDVHAVAEAYAIAEEQVHACIGLLLRHPLPILGRVADEEDPEVMSAETD